jgi:hypothetical protein
MTLPLGAVLPVGLRSLRGVTRYLERGVRIYMQAFRIFSGIESQIILVRSSLEQGRQSRAELGTVLP